MIVQWEGDGDIEVLVNKFDIVSRDLLLLMFGCECMYY